MTAITSTIADSEAVARLVVRERQARDRGWWEQMADCFAQDAVVEMSWFTGPGAEFVARSREMSAGGWGRLSVHRLSPPAVRVHGDRALAELPLVIEFRIDADGVEADLLASCRSQYRIQRTNRTWRISRITSIYEKDPLTPSVPGTQPDIDPAEFATFRPSYRCLAWRENRLGRPLRGDLLGADRPEPVARQYQAEAAWLAGSI